MRWGGSSPRTEVALRHSEMTRNRTWDEAWGCALLSVDVSKNTEADAGRIVVVAFEQMGVTVEAWRTDRAESLRGCERIELGQRG